MLIPMAELPFILHPILLQLIKRPIIHPPLWFYRVEIVHNPLALELVGFSVSLISNCTVWVVERAVTLFLVMKLLADI